MGGPQPLEKKIAELRLRPKLRDRLPLVKQGISGLRLAVCGLRLADSGRRLASGCSRQTANR